MTHDAAFRLNEDMEFHATFYTCRNVPSPQKVAPHRGTHSTKFPGSKYQHQHHVLHFPLEEHHSSEILKGSIYTSDKDNLEMTCDIPISGGR